QKVTITAICDVNQTEDEEVAKMSSIPQLFEKYDEMFATMYIDAVVICTPNKFHADITIAALKAGAHVLCEKPMAMNRLESQKMINAAKEAATLLPVGYHHRYTEPARMAKAAISEKKIGDPLVTRIRALRRRKVPGWGV